MSMTTELIDRLRTNANWLDEEDNDERAIRKSMLEAADTIKLLSEKLHASQMERSSQYYHSGWIPVSERLPEQRKEVLTCSIGGFIEIQSLEDDYWENQHGDFTDYDEVISWMPLPEPFKAESEE